MARIFHNTYYYGDCVSQLRLPGLKYENSFLPVLGAGKSKIKVPADLVPGESSSPGPFSLCPPLGGVRGLRESLSFSSSTATVLLD